ncbi:MAG: hypothetical protein ACKVS9_18175 [Phycisphaerae bacterium]
MAFAARLATLGTVASLFFATAITAPPVLAQESQLETGPATAAAGLWQNALTAMAARGDSETAIGELLASNPSPFRLALLAERTELRTKQGGVLLTLQQDVANAKAGENAKKLWELLERGREQMNQADDGWYFASVGQFGIAAANFQALVAANPDAVALLEFSERVQRRQQILVTLASDPIMGESVRGILKLLSDGEQAVKADPGRIKQNVEKLAGAPRQYENALAALKDSGEYSVPFFVQTLRDPAQRSLTQPIVRTLPKIDRAALNPLVMATRVDDQAVRMIVVRALGQIPYFQSIPYLMSLREDAKTPADVRSAAEASLSDLAGRGIKVPDGATAADAFYALAQAYYRNDNTVAADTRLTTANVWYHRDGLIQNIPVPTAIFNDIMAMRCCEEALRLNADMKPALALWIASNARREAELGDGETDATRPDNYPSAAYYAQSAGTEYNLLALARAIDDGDAVVALMAIDALAKTSGPASVLGKVGDREPLGEALNFPERIVRIRAALALAGAMPDRTFENSQNLMPVLGEALSLYAGSSNALVVDPEEMSGNQLAAHLRGAGYTVVTDRGLYDGLSRARKELPGIDLIVIASNVQQPAIAEAIRQIRSETQLGNTPVIIAAKKGDADAAAELVRREPKTGDVPSEVNAESLLARVGFVARGAGAQAIDATLGAALALDAARVVGKLTMSKSTVVDVAAGEKGLVGLLASTDPQLRLTAGAVLGFMGGSAGQAALAEVALTATEPAEIRINTFAALAESAMRSGNQLGDELVKRLITAAESEADLAVRTAASQALGALNLPGNPASTIIRNQYGG